MGAKLAAGHPAVSVREGVITALDASVSGVAIYLQPQTGPSLKHNMIQKMKRAARLNPTRNLKEKFTALCSRCSETIMNLSVAQTVTMTPCVALQ